MKRSCLRKSRWAAALAVLVVVTVSPLAACGGSDTSTTEAASPFPSVAVAVSSTPTPTPTHTWTPGAKPIPAASFPAQKPADPPYYTCTNGWEFKPKVDLKVTALGFYDHGGNGLRGLHPAGIFDTATEKLLVKTTIQRKSSLDGFYRYATIKPLTLEAGKSYVVAVLSSYPPFDPEVKNPWDLVWAPEIEYLGYRETKTQEFIFPGPMRDMFISANFKYKPL